MGARWLRTEMAVKTYGESSATPAVDRSTTIIKAVTSEEIIVGENQGADGGSDAIMGNQNIVEGEGINGSWDMELLHDVFNSRDIAAISAVPILQVAAIDSFTWHFELSGIYSVKSAFLLLQKEKGAWDTVEASKFWNELWRLKIPPKIKNLIWRGGTNCLQLITKRVQVDSLCPVCDSHNETIMHVLAFCPIAAQCWEKAAIRIPTQQDTSFLDWCVSVFNSANTATCSLFCVLCWSIWGARNDKVWKNKNSNASFIFAFAVCHLEQWTSAQAPYLETSRTGLLAGDGNDRWEAGVTRITQCSEVDHEVLNDYTKWKKHAG
ncbi:hypothetical protein G4B88_018085 [Cannabis sativa]|uniref:Reverse transcriptase zinc-binding domain-containing protein n=1 Tax=Cannabis sativa TaxID=3483 RepID=A0A7J6FSW6_CANSA|nr:hypothetical protein G4B88_018085 [Cannabis sativa]